MQGEGPGERVPNSSSACTFITLHSVHEVRYARLDLLDGGRHVSSNARWQRPL